MSGRGGIYGGPDGQELHGDGQPVSRPRSDRPVEVPPNQRFKLANRDIEEAVAMMDHPPMHRSCFVLGMELAMRIVKNSAETSFNGKKPDETMINGINSMIRLIQVQIGSGRMDMSEITWSPEEIDEVRRIS
jgi:hypothetical protein